jgi:hypothetical protein
MFNSPIVGIVNSALVALMDAPVVGRLARRSIVVIRYVGRRSGTTFETPVGYRWRGDEIVIGVVRPQDKNWWRNFLDDGGPVTLLGLDGRDRSGHAQAHRDDGGGVSVTVRLDP